MAAFDTTNYYDVITEKCKSYYEEKSGLTPVEMANEIMSGENFPMHSPHHHYIIPAVMLTAACINKEKDSSTLEQYLRTAEKRAKQVPGAVCGEMGTCGAGVGVGIFASIWLNTTPYDTNNLGTVGSFTVAGLEQICRYPGPRCCKRVTFLALEAASKKANELELAFGESKRMVCRYSHKNKDCIKESCQYFR